MTAVIQLCKIEFCFASLCRDREGKEFCFFEKRKMTMLCKKVTVVIVIFLQVIEARQKVELGLTFRWKSLLKLGILR
jgi:hypothetical protein